MDISKIESIEEFGKLTDNAEVTEVEVNLIKYEDRTEKVFDIRRWKSNPNGNKEPLEGISLTVDELEELKEVLESIKAE